MGKLTTALTLATLSLGLVGGCDIKPKEPESFRIELGSYNKSLSSPYVMYNGMNGENNYSLSWPGMEDAVNIFYPTNLKQINFYNRRFEVDTVTPEYIDLEYLGTK